MLLTKDFAQNLLDRAKKLGAEQSEVYINSITHLKIDVINRKIESFDNISEGGLGVRIIKDKKMGFAYTADLDEHAIENTITQAINNSKNTTPDIHLNFPVPENQNTSIPLVDDDIKNTDIKDKIFLSLETEKEAFAYDKRVKKSEKVGYQESLATTMIANSNGVSILYDKATCGLFAEVIAEENDQMETGTWFKFSAKYKDIDPKYVGGEAAKKAVTMLGAIQEKSGKAAVLLSPNAAATLLSAISPALSADFAQKGKSIFRGAVDKPVSSRKLTIVDSGILLNGVASVPYDDEGVPTQETKIITDGIFRSFLHNCYTAKKSKSRSTANSLRMSFKSQPEISPTNLYIKPGHRSADELMEGMSKGFLIENIMGAHTINPISGDFSIGFSGFYIENGKQSRPVRGMTIAGNILDVFNHIEDIGSDLMFFPYNGNIGAPSILISNLSVGGK